MGKKRPETTIRLAGIMATQSYAAQVEAQAQQRAREWQAWLAVHWRELSAEEAIEIAQWFRRCGVDWTITYEDGHAVDLVARLLGPEEEGEAEPEQNDGAPLLEEGRDLSPFLPDQLRHRSSRLPRQPGGGLNHRVEV